MALHTRTIVPRHCCALGTQMPQSCGQPLISPAPQTLSPHTTQSAGHDTSSPFSQMSLPHCAAQSAGQSRSSPTSHRPLPHTSAGRHSPETHTCDKVAQSVDASADPLALHVNKVVPLQRVAFGLQVVEQSPGQLAGVSPASHTVLPQTPGATQLPAPQTSPMVAQSNTS